MSLLSINTKQLNKLSLKEVKLPAPKERELEPLEVGIINPEPIIVKPIELIKEIKDNENEYNRLRERIKANRERIKQYENEIATNLTDINALENTFTEVAKRCEFKWYVPKFITEPPEALKIKELLYWLS
jgi:predicted nuclease with TOPRIM domain